MYVNWRFRGRIQQWLLQKCLLPALWAALLWILVSPEAEAQITDYDRRVVQTLIDSEQGRKSSGTCDVPDMDVKDHLLVRRAQMRTYARSVDGNQGGGEYRIIAGSQQAQRLAASWRIVTKKEKVSAAQIARRTVSEGGRRYQVFQARRMIEDVLFELRLAYPEGGDDNTEDLVRRFVTFVANGKRNRLFGPDKHVRNRGRTALIEAAPLSGGEVRTSQARKVEEERLPLTTIPPTRLPTTLSVKPIPKTALSPAAGTAQTTRLAAAAGTRVTQPRPDTSGINGWWDGPMENSRGEKLKSSRLRLKESPPGTVQGVWHTGWKLENGIRKGDLITWQHRGLMKGCRDYDVRMELLKQNRKRATLIYKAVDRCRTPGRYSGKVRLKKE